MCCIVELLQEDGNEELLHYSLALVSWDNVTTTCAGSAGVNPACVMFVLINS